MPAGSDPTDAELNDIKDPYAEHDAALLNALSGATFGPNVKLILPSGKTIDGATAQELTARYVDAAQEKKPARRRWWWPRQGKKHLPAPDEGTPS